VINEMSADQVGATAQIAVGEAGRGGSKGTIKAPNGNVGYAVVVTHFQCGQFVQASDLGRTDSLHPGGGLRAGQIPAGTHGQLRSTTDRHMFLTSAYVPARRATCGLLPTCQPNW
jgi:hypothetical protein